MTEQTQFKGLLPPPKTPTGLYEWMNKAWISLNQILSGKLNATIVGIVLTPNADQTIIQDYRIGGSTVLVFVPKSVNAAAEIGNGTMILGEPVSGAVALGHANNAQEDRIFDAILIG